MDVILVHGYNVTSTRTYGVLPQRLKDAGHSVQDVHLSKYVTLDDGISMPDLIRAFDAALRDLYGASFGNKKFACVTHSTGALVVRAWADQRFGSAVAKLPISHLIMLAPPNNGSRLAELGKSRLSRLRSLVGIEPGLLILDALELGSRFQWDLNSAWMNGKLVSAANFFPFVIAGQWIDHKLWDAIIPATYERGSDGVVRAASANLNMQKITVAADGRVSRISMDGLAFLLTPKTSHSDASFGIMGSVPAQGEHRVLGAILEALNVGNRKAYATLAAGWARRTDDLQATERFYDNSPLDRYCQIVFRVTDDRGWPLDDYAIELCDDSLAGGHLPPGFFSDNHKNGRSPEMFTYYLDHDRVRQAQGGKFGFKVSCAAGSPLVAYADAVLVAPIDGGIAQPNRTTLVDVVLKRRLNKAIFQITSDLSEQKIDGTPGEEWIDED